MAASVSVNSEPHPQVLQPLRDSVLRGIAYDHSDLRLVLGFRNGRTMEYMRVPRPVYEAFLDSQPRSWAAAGSLPRRYRQRQVSPIPITARRPSDYGSARWADR